MDEPVVTESWRRFVWLAALGGPVLLVVLHLAGDALYAAYVASNNAAWEKTVERDDEGVLAGSETNDLQPRADVDRDTAIVLVHGMGASPRHYDLVAPALAELGYRVRVLRLPGFAEPLEKYRATKAADWTGAVTDALADLRKVSGRVGVVGHSLGGATVLGALLDEPDSADFAVLLAPAIEVCDERSPLLSVRSWREVSKRTLVFTQVLESAFPLDCRDPSRANHPGRTPYTPLTVVDELFHLMDAIAPRAEQLKLPVSMILARKDKVVDTPAAEAYFRRLGSAQKELIVLDETGHELPMDYQWRKVVEAIDRRAEGVIKPLSTPSGG